ncbi:PF20097 family protein [Maledivibacter halophilus]|uniref:DUF6487 domain-containing protein n=1 Tax=Maledivibacter halophilus TaxID=36842 RepID=A0A1T5IQQ6_9FIRM|nr:PF20097 family protein [Maledivibacter halophilus]SKC41509.1 hypothetical protein SAMN02194393_00647 [Maledivibacter halophilus]
MKLECPYCEGNLIKGFIGNFHYGNLKWYDDNLNLLNKFTVFGGKTLKQTMNSKVECYTCKDCNKIIIDLDNI